MPQNDNINNNKKDVSTNERRSVGSKIKKKIKKAANYFLGKKKEKKLPGLFEHFLDLPQDLIFNHIVPELDPKTTLNLAIVNKFTLAMFKSKEFTPEAQLVHYVVVEPNDSKVCEILNQHPELVQTKIKKVKDKSGRTLINATPLQLAYYAVDNKMCKTLKPYIAQICGGEKAGIEEMQRQIKEKEIKESEENEKQIKEDLANLLATVIQAISSEQFNQGCDPKTNKLILNDATLKAITAFREAFDETQPKVVDKGMHFRLQTLQEVCEAYGKAAREQWNFNYNKCALFEDGVLAHVLKYVPANITQEFNQGLYYRQHRKEKFERANKTVDGYHFYRYLRGDSDDFHLSGSCVDIIRGLAGGVRNDAALGVPPCAIAGSRRFADLASNKNSKLKYLCSDLETENVPMRPLS